MKRLVVTIVGAGPGSIPHLKALADLADSIEVKWIASRTSARLAAITGFPITTDVAAAISDPMVDAVLVLTPPAAHFSIASADSWVAIARQTRALYLGLLPAGRQAVASATVVSERE